MKNKRDPIIFTEAMMTGVAAIDEQHRIMVNMLNEANKKLARNNSKSEIKRYASAFS